MRRSLIGLTSLVLILSACSPADEAEQPTTTTTTEPSLPTSGPPRPDMTLESPAFDDGVAIPARFTCDGEDISPELHVLNTPPGTVTLAIVVNDPDAPVGVWDHWVEYDIPNVEEVDQTWEEGVPRLGTPGINSWNLPGYGGPCPPEGQTHRYFFAVYAIEAELLIPEGVDSAALMQAIQGHVLAEARLMGTYSR